MDDGGRGTVLKRFGIAAAIALGIYGVSLSVGVLLYATDNIATGATHNDCGDLKHEIAVRDYGGDEALVPQEQLKQESITCLEGHERTEADAFRTYAVWGIWPALISAFAFLAWPVWTRILHRQEEADPVEDAPRLEPGT